MKIKLMNRFFFLSIFLCVCSSLSSQNYVAIHGRLLNKIIVEVSREYHAKVYSKGGGFIGRLNEFNISFYYSYPIDLKSAEKMYYGINRKIVGIYNSDLKIRPYLASFPFDDKIDIGLWLRGNQCVGEIIRIRNYGSLVLYSFIGEDGTEVKRESTLEELYRSAFGQID